MDEKAIKKRLTDLLEQTQKHLASLNEAGQTVELDQARMGRLSRMDALQQQAMSKARIQQLKIDVQKIQGALKRLEDGEYGFCMKCHQEISQKRMDFDPCAFICVQCAG